MTIPYEPINWQAGTKPPLQDNDELGMVTSVPRLRRIDDGIVAATEGVRLLEQLVPSKADVDDVVTASTADRSRSNHTGVQTADTISDFAEAAQDAVAALLAAGTGVTLAYNDAGNTLTVTSAGTGGVTDPEVVRDTIGTALLGVGAVSVAVNDAADTITISTTATINRSDSATDTLLAAKAAVTHKAAHATGGADALTPADIGALRSVNFGSNPNTPRGGSTGTVLWIGDAGVTPSLTLPGDVVLNAS